MFRFISSNVKYINNFRYGPSYLEYIYFYQDPSNTNTPLFFDYSVNGDFYSNDAFYFNNVKVYDVNYYYATIAPFIV